MRKITSSIIILILISTVLFFGIFCSKSTVKVMTNLSISGSSNQIIIDGEKYSFSISKFDGIATLSNRAGDIYTSFPLHAQLSNHTGTLSSPQIDWHVKDQQIKIEISKQGILYQEIMIKPHPSAIEIKFGINFTPEDKGVFFFKKGDIGFENDSIEKTFSPEPDDYYSSTPQVNVRVDTDQQWAFAPAPLNLSFQTKAGWFSIGLAKLPNASVFAYKEQAIYVDYPWHHIKPPAQGFYWLDPLVITFNESPWEAAHDFQSFLTDQKLIADNTDKVKNRPAWWFYPLVSTKGEQIIQEITNDHDEYKSEWVKNYIINQEAALDSINFNVVIDDKWVNAYSDPHPHARFGDMRQLIDWCHERGHKVLLSWRAWKIEANSFVIKHNIGDGEYIDATHPMFEAYADTCCQILFGNGEGQLNADGLKFDDLFLVREPFHATYNDPALGMGVQELHYYMKMFYKYAKKYKPTSLISSTAVNPYFNDVQDMVRINSAWDNKLRREKRARIAANTLPNTLIDGDATDMYSKIALYHYITSSIYGVPSIQYLTRFHDGEFSDKIKEMITQILKLSSKKLTGKLEFVNYGNWRIVKDDKMLAESLPQGKGIVVYTNDNDGTLLCAQDKNVHLVLNKRSIKSVKDENGKKISFKHRGAGIYELCDVRQGGVYKLSLKRTSGGL